MNDLYALRVRAAASYAWRTKKGTVVSEAQYDAMPEVTEEQRKAKAKFQWRPDPKVIGELVKAERAETARIHGARAVMV